MIHERISHGEAAVFLDPTGRRGRLVQRIGYAASAGCLAYIALVGVNLAGGSINAPLLPQAAVVRSSIERLLATPGRYPGAATQPRRRRGRVDLPRPGAAGGVSPAGSWQPAAPVPVPAPSPTRRATASPTPRRTTAPLASPSPQSRVTVSPSASTVTPSAGGTATPTLSPSVLPSLAPVG